MLKAVKQLCCELCHQLCFETKTGTYQPAIPLLVTDKIAQLYRVHHTSFPALTSTERLVELACSNLLTYKKSKMHRTLPF